MIFHQRPFLPLVSHQLADGNQTPSEHDPRQSSDFASLEGLLLRSWRAPQTILADERQRRYLKEINKPFIQCRFVPSSRIDKTFN